MRTTATHWGLVGAAALLTLLIGCGPSVEGYVDDPEERRDVLARCAKLEIDPTEDERCAMAMEAEGIAAKNAVSDLFSGE